MIIRTAKKQSRFAVIDKTGLEDINLSWDAKGILCYVLAKPDNWQVHINELAKNSADGITVVRSAIQELIMAGYVSKKRIFNEKTKQIEGVEYVFYEIPIIEEEEKKKETTKTIRKTKNITSNKEKATSKIKNIEQPEVEPIQEFEQESIEIDKEKNNLYVHNLLTDEPDVKYESAKQAQEETTENQEQSVKTREELPNLNPIWQEYQVMRKTLKNPILIQSIQKISHKLLKKGGVDFETWAVETAIENQYFNFKIEKLYERYLDEKNYTQIISRKPKKNFILERDYASSDEQSTDICEDNRNTSKTGYAMGIIDWDEDDLEDDLDEI